MTKRRNAQRKRVTIKDIARNANVSVGTVSNYLNGTVPVSESTSQQIEAAIKELNYQPNMNARSLRSQRTLSLGLIVPNISNPFFAEMARRIEHHAWETGYQIFLCDSDENSDREEAHLQTLYQRRVDGVIIIHTGNKRLPDLVDTWSIPTLFVDRYLKGYPSVVTDNEMGGRLALQHLVGLGHRRIGIIAGDAQIDNVQERLSGAYQVLKESNITLPTGYFIEGTQSIETGLMVEKFWNLPEPPSAIFTTNDVIALGVWQSCLSHEIRIPDDLSLVGFDDIQWSALTVPPLTTVAQDIEAICDTAIDKLHAAINGSSLAGKTDQIEPHLVVRSSTTQIK